MTEHADADFPFSKRLARVALPLYLVILLLQNIYVLAWVSDDWRHAPISGTDGQAYYAPLRSLVVDGDLDFQNEFTTWNVHGHGLDRPGFLPRSPRTGLIFNRYPVGFALLLTPFFLAAHALAQLGLGPPTGYSPPYQLAVVANALFWNAAAFAALAALLRRFFTPAVAALAVLTLLLAYQGAHQAIAFQCNPHPQTLCVYAFMLLLGLRVAARREGLGTWAALGALTGLAALLRTELAVLALTPLCLWIARFSRAEARRALAAGAVCAAAAVLVFAPQIVVWRMLWGEWFVTPMNNPGERFNWGRPALREVLFSTRHGLFYWSPILAPALAGFVLLFREKPRSSLFPALALQALALWYLYAAWNIWWMGYSFGARQFIVLTPLFALGLGRLFVALRRRPVLAAALAVPFVLWNWAMLQMFLNGHIPRNEGFPPWLPLVRFFEQIGRLVP